jgi:glycosyltransferase involved in cell wall biosynthesis
MKISTQQSPENLVILWLASWYPNRLDPWSGDFIQRSAKALAIHHPVDLLHIMKDEKGRLTRRVLIEKQQNGNLTETIIYYKPISTGIAVIDKLISNYTYLSLGKRWLKAYRKQNAGVPMIVEVAVAMRAGLLALWMNRKWGQPYHVQEHWTGYYTTLMPPELQRSKIWWRLSDTILKNAVHFLPDSRQLGEHINQNRLRIPFDEIPNCVDLTVFFPKEKKAGQNFRFVHVSTLTHQKNVDGLLRAFAHTLRRHPHTELVMVGPNADHWKAWVEADPLLKAAVHFTGSLPYNEVARQMQAADALLLFSRYENLPCVMLEAWCCGLPVVATDVGGIAYHLTPDNGILVTSENEEALAAGMGRIINQFASFDRAQIAANARAAYSFKTIAEKYAKAYHKIYPQLPEIRLKSGI